MTEMDNNSPLPAAAGSSLLAGLLIASAVYDGLGFILLWSMPRWLFTWFHHPIPANPFLFRLAALPLLLLPLVYVSAARMGSRCPVLIRLSIALRIVGAVGIALLLIWHLPPGQGAYWCFVVGDIVWAGLYVVGAKRSMGA